MKKSFLFISCEEAKHICDKRQYNEAKGWERFKLGLRLIWCNVTRAYSGRNVKLSKAIDKAHLDCLNKAEKKNIEQQFEKELAKHQ